MRKLFVRTVIWMLNPSSVPSWRKCQGRQPSALFRRPVIEGSVLFVEGIGRRFCLA